MRVPFGIKYMTVFLRTAASALSMFAILADACGQQFVVSGRVTSAGQPVPFTNIVAGQNRFVTSSNEEGTYSLRLPAGRHRLTYLQLGYSTHTISLSVQKDTTVDVSLMVEEFALQEVEVKAGEDPAYRIIREAISKRKFHREQVKAYSCLSYIKGLYRIDRLPRSLGSLIKIGGGVASDTNEIKGIIYLSESENRFYFQRPDKRKEVMISSKVSGHSDSYSFNQLSGLRPDFYQDVIPLGNVASRPYVSPVAGNAMSFYRFILLGTSGHIHKIRVIPRRDSDPCFKGIIYIQEGSFRITGVDLSILKPTGLRIADSLGMNQKFAQVDSADVWMPSQLDLQFRFSMMGLRGSGYFHAGIREYRLHDSFPANFFTNEVLKVTEDAGKKDSTYWAERRTVPLTEEERLDYREKDSLEVVKGTSIYKDSVDKVHNRFRTGNLLFGYSYSSSKKKFTMNVPGIVANGVQYNTVEGWNASYRFSLLKELKDYRQYEITAHARYGFSNYLWGGDLAYERFFDPIKHSRFRIRAKSIVEQFNRDAPIAPLLNSMYTLFYNQNHMKLFRESGVDVSHATELANGLFLSSSLSYMERSRLVNTSLHPVYDHPEIWFTGNDPRISTGENNFGVHNALVADLRVNIAIRQQYSSLPGRKINHGSRYPRFVIHYTKALPYAGAVIDYDRLIAGIFDRLDLKLWGRLRYVVRAGTYLRTGRMHFMDYQHFQGNQTHVLSRDLSASFRLLPYYEYSTNRQFAEAHLDYNLGGALLSRVPLVKKLHLSEVISAHFLSNDLAPRYAELTVGIDRLLGMIRLEYAASVLPGGQISHGFMFGIRTEF
jgi:hypothetical protein